MAEQHTKVEYFRSELQVVATVMEYSIQGETRWYKNLYVPNI